MYMEDKFCNILYVHLKDKSLMMKWSIDDNLAFAKIFSLLLPYLSLNLSKYILSHDVASRSDKRACNKIDKPLVVYRYRFSKVT